MKSANITTSPLFQEKSLRLYEALVSGNGLGHIVQIATKVFHNPVSISDSSFRLLEYSKQVEVKDPVWNDIINHGMVSLDVIRKFNEERVIDRVLSSELPVIIADGIGEKIPRILGKISIADNIVGYVGVFQLNHTLTEEDVQLSKILASILSVELSKNPKVSKLTGTLLENLFIDLFNEVPMEDSEILQRLVSCSWTPHPNFYLLHIPMGSSIYSHYRVEYIYSYLQQFSEGIRCIHYNNAVLVVLSYEEEQDLTSFWETMSSLLKSNMLSCGVSFPFQHLKKLKSAWEQARTSYTLGRELSKESPLHFFEDYYDLHLIKKMHTVLDLSEYAHPGILKLIQYDREHNSSYASTLLLYINTQCNLSETAKKLFIHRNTMIHRLGRIMDIAEISSLENEDLFRILLTYKIHTFQRVLKKL